MQTTLHLIFAELTGALLTVRINTQDSRVGIYAVELQDGNRRQTSIDWPFGVSDQPTVEVHLELAGAGREISTQVISGDLWRDLESQDLEDEFLDRVLRGADAQVTASDLLGTTIQFGDAEAQVYRVNSEHGYDDYDVIGHPVVHRITVGHGIKKGDIFNVYCADSRKVGGQWTGSLVPSFASVLQTLAAESAA